MEDYYWDSKLDYLSKTRWLYYNDDYLAFLVTNVWKLDRPVRILDFGCGYGFLGLKLLPLLPEGSAYTGIDAGERLIAQAKELFAPLPYDTQFLAGDISQMEFSPEYDLAVCHAFLMHMPDPLATLQQMADSTVGGGRVICFEANWIANAANTYVHGLTQSDVVPLGPLQALYEQDAARTGKDGNIGMKLPAYMSRLGLRDVQCRMSDRVNVLDPQADEGAQDRLFQSMREDGFGASPGEREPYMERLSARGLREKEAKKLYEAERLLADRVDRSAYVTAASGMKITFGTVVRS